MCDNCVRQYNGTVYFFSKNCTSFRICYKWPCTTPLLIVVCVCMYIEYIVESNICRCLFQICNVNMAHYTMLQTVDPASIPGVAPSLIDNDI